MYCHLVFNIFTTTSSFFEGEIFYKVLKGAVSKKVSLCNPSGLQSIDSIFPRSPSSSGSHKTAQEQQEQLTQIFLSPQVHKVFYVMALQIKCR